MIPSPVVPNCPMLSKFYQFLKGPEPYMSSDIFEQGMRTAYMISLGIFKNSLCYLFPFVGGIFFNYRKMEPDNFYTESYLDKKSVKQLTDELEFLEENIELKKKTITLCTGTLLSPHSYGGAHSITKPLIALPESFINRNNSLPAFGQFQEKLSDILHFSDDETRFLIAREVAYIKEDHTLFRTLTKIALLISTFWIFTPKGLIATALINWCYFSNEHSFQTKMDIRGVELLQKTYNKTKEQSFWIAINTLEKLRLRNIEQRRHNPKMELFISEEGDNSLDINLPPLTHRLNNLIQLISAKP
jgi:hypothetical protein